jgi:hypothetical protein
MHAASLGATPLLQVGRPGEAEGTQNLAKAVSPMQACAVHLCHRTPRRCRVARVPRLPKLATRALHQAPFMLGILYVTSISLNLQPLSRCNRYARLRIKVCASAALAKAQS